MAKKIISKGTNRRSTSNEGSSKSCCNHPHHRSCSSSAFRPTAIQTIYNFRQNSCHEANGPNNYNGFGSSHHLGTNRHFKSESNLLGGTSSTGNSLNHHPLEEVMDNYGGTGSNSVQSFQNAGYHHQHNSSIQFRPTSSSHHNLVNASNSFIPINHHQPYDGEDDDDEDHQSGSSEVVSRDRSPSTNGVTVFKTKVLYHNKNELRPLGFPSTTVGGGRNLDAGIPRGLLTSLEQDARV